MFSIFFHPSLSDRRGSSGLTPLEVARPRRARLLTGLTLIEMLVVITIFLIMTAVVMANFPAFRDRTGLQLIAQEIATTIRQAQVYGIGTRAAGGAFKSHGLYFDLTASDGKKSFILYADVNSPSGVGGGDVNSPVEKFAIRGAAEIESLQGCAADPCTPVALTSLDILFQRFYPEATFIGLAPAPSYVRIVLKSTRTNDQKWVEVWSTGQIVVTDQT
ncbi:MAG: hypothetical protein HY481_01670 [Candidatus Vogelbacteria bacterium]|nr:hypothetical protein [Candidatus Vogelbacteria bacterium]